MVKQNQKRNGKYAIYLRLIIDSKRIELSTFQYASDAEWNKTLQRLKPKSINADSINIMLTTLQSDIHRHFSSLEFICVSRMARTLM